VVPPGNSFDQTPHNRGTLDGDALPGAVHLNDAQIDDLTLAGKRGEYGHSDLDGHSAYARGAQHAMPPGDRSGA
jgi:hypothetical protein